MWHWIRWTYLNLEYNQWDDALQLIEQHPSYAPQVYLPYAQWLVEKDRFDEAQEWYHDAADLLDEEAPEGREEEAKVRRAPPPRFTFATPTWSTRPPRFRSAPACLAAAAADEGLRDAALERKPIPSGLQ